MGAALCGQQETCGSIGSFLAQAMNTIPAVLELAAALCNLPDFWHTDHPILNVQRAYAYGYANRLWPKEWAARLAFRAAMEATQARGKGSRAARREADILTHKLATGPGLTFSQATRRFRLQRAADLLTEQTPEARSLAHHYRTNIHD